MNLNKVNIGVLGCSSIAERSTIPAIIENNGLKLIAIGSRDKQKAEKLASKFGCIGGSYDEILDNPAIDAIYLPLPAGLHYEWGMKVLQSRKHLLMEKPFTDSYEKAVELINFSKSRSLIAMEFLTYVYHPLILKVFELVKSKEIGNIRLIEASFGFPVLPKEDIRNNPSLGGGAILDNLIYPLSLCLHLLDNEYKKISYQIIEGKEYLTDERGFLRLDAKNASAHINYGFGFFYRNSFTIWGDSGIIEVDRAFTRPKDMAGKIIIKKNGVTETNIITAPADQFGETINAFYSKITGHDRTEKNEGRDILYRMKIISDMYVAFTGKKLKQ